MNDKKSVDPGTVWWFWFASSAFDVDKRLRRLFRVLPHDPRCKFCLCSLSRSRRGHGAVCCSGKERSALNPSFCNMCDVASRKYPGRG